jgi:hypothetical protein
VPEQLLGGRGADVRHAHPLAGAGPATAGDERRYVREPSQPSSWTLGGRRAPSRVDKGVQPAGRSEPVQGPTKERRRVLGVSEPLRLLSDSFPEGRAGSREAYARAGEGAAMTPLRAALRFLLGVLLLAAQAVGGAS